MLSPYTAYICNKCKKEFVLLTEEVESNRGYLVCPYCSSKHIKKQKIGDSLKECMKERAYVRVKGAIRQK